MVRLVTAGRCISSSGWAPPSDKTPSLFAPPRNLANAALSLPATRGRVDFPFIMMLAAMALSLILVLRNMRSGAVCECSLRCRRKTTRSTPAYTPISVCFFFICSHSQGRTRPRRPPPTHASSRASRCGLRGGRHRACSVGNDGLF